MSVPKLIFLFSMLTFLSYCSVAQENGIITLYSKSLIGFPLLNKTVGFIEECNPAPMGYLPPGNTQFQDKIVVPLPEKMLVVHGNILYNSSYRSYIDTPFAQEGLVQNMVQTNLNFTFKNKYPVKLTITSRQNNSPWFKNATDINAEFSQRQLLDNIKNDLRKRTVGAFTVSPLSQAQKLYADCQQQVQQLQSWLNSPARAQEIVEEKEKELRERMHNPGLNSNINPASISPDPKKNLSENISLPSKNSIDSGTGTNKLKDSALVIYQNKLPDSTLVQKYAAKQKELTKLLAELKKKEIAVQQVRKLSVDSVNKIKSEINSLNSATELYSFMTRNAISRNELTNAQRLLLSVNKIGIGRNWIDYSELTVKNVSLSGVNIEVSPGGFYFAAAAGKVNYRFRDFILKDNKSLPDQSLYLVRAGIGLKEKNNIIFTFYNGKKSILNPSPITGNLLPQRVLGVSAETRLSLNANNYIIAEVAKSSYNNNILFQPTSSDLLKKAFDLKTHTNEAYSIKLFSQNPSTDTRITGYYKNLGENFQSFNLYPININEDSWMLRLNQNLWKRKVNIDAAIRKNDFVSPIATPVSFATKMVFKSLQVSVRIPKYPFVSIGFYPTSQLSLASNNLLVENQYNTLNAVSSYNYSYHKIAMNTNIVFTKFYNNNRDTGFIYYNATSYSATQSIFLAAFRLQSTASITQQKDLDLLTLEQSMTYSTKHNISLTAGLKWNRLNRMESLYGGTAGLSFYIKKLGSVQFNYDKSFLPGYNRDLRPVDLGRMSFYRNF